ncbi:MAG: TolC family protein [Elusimicrobia bacterium]|nr:TolC family protein [Elusimicrobiota bacterium]
MTSLLLTAALIVSGLWSSPAQGAVVVPAAPAFSIISAPAEPGLQELAFDLDGALAIALKNDSRLLSAEQDRIIAQQRLSEAKLEFLPEFGLQASAAKFDARYPIAFSPALGSVLGFPRGSIFNPTGSENIYSGRGYMNFPLYEGGRSVNTLRMAQAALKQAQSNYETVKMEVVLAVKEAFYRLLMAQERLAATTETVSEAQRMAAALSLSPWERIEAEGIGEKSRQWAAEAMRQSSLRRLDFLKALNLELDAAFRIAGRIEPQSVAVDPQKAALWALELRPELQAETFKAEMDALAVNLAISRRYPTLFLAGDYDFTDQHFPLLNNNWDVGIGIKLPFTYDVLTKLRQKRAEQRQGQLKRAALQDQVRLEVRQACEQLAYWSLEAGLRSQQFRAVSGIYDKAAPAAPASLGKLRALMTVIEMRLSYLESATESTLARARLERAVGRELAP